MNKSPPPMTPSDCGVLDMPFPHALLVILAAEAFGLTEAKVTELAKSLGWTRVGDGWIMGKAGNA